MLDLSNNNADVNWHRVYQSGQRRIYLKLTEGDHFVDPDHSKYAHGAWEAHLKVGFYHFARPSSNSALEEGQHFVRCLPPGWKKPGRTLRPCLDLEDNRVKPGIRIAVWADAFIKYVKKHTGITPIIYGSSYYLQACGFPSAPCSLWLASYGRNDGKEHPFVIPKPWTSCAAHQYASTARVAGVAGPVDISHVFKPRKLDISRLSR